MLPLNDSPCPQYGRGRTGPARYAVRHGCALDATRPVAAGGHSVRVRLHRRRGARHATRQPSLRRRVRRSDPGLPIPREFWEACSRAGGATVVTVALVFVLVCGPHWSPTTCGDHRRDAWRTEPVHARRQGLRGEGTTTRRRSHRHVGVQFSIEPRPSCTATYGLIAVVVWRSDLPRPLRLIVAVIGVTLPILVGLADCPRRALSE